MVRALTGIRNQQALWPNRNRPDGPSRVGPHMFRGPERGRGERRYALRRRAMCPGVAPQHPLRLLGGQPPSEPLPRVLLPGCASALHREGRVEPGIAGASRGPPPITPKVAPREQTAGIGRSVAGRMWPSTDLFASGGRRGRAHPGPGPARPRFRRSVRRTRHRRRRSTRGGDQPAAAINPQRVPAISCRRPGRRESRPGSRRSRRSARSWRRSGAARRPRRRTAPRGSRMPSPGR